MADRRRMSPEGSARTERTRQEPRRSVYDEPQRMRSRGADELSSSSSSSSSYLDISRSFPPNKAGLLTFFTAPSERRKLRRRRSKKGLFKINTGNSSSSSLDGDLAYGTGFIKQAKRSVRSRKGKDIDRERYSERERDKYRDRDQNRDRAYSDRERPGSGIGKRPGSGLGRAVTDAEILAVGAGLAKLARDQNKADLKARGNPRKSEVIVVNEPSFGPSGTSRGLGPSKISNGPEDFDEDGWESASDDESDFSVNSALAFDNDNNSSKWKNFFGRRKYKPKSRKSSVVDPRLFGPENSLHGVLDGPVGFGDVTWNSSTEFGQGSTFSLGASESASASQSQQSLTKLYPVATDDGTRYEAGRGSAVPGQYSSQPGSTPRADSRYASGKESSASVQYNSQPVPPVTVNPRYESGRGPDQYSSPQYRPAAITDRYQESSRFQEPPTYEERSKYEDRGKYPESTRFQDVKDSAISGADPYISRRPEQIPLQQPQPMTPVSQSIFEPNYITRSDSGGILKKTSSSTGRNNSLAKAALAGVAGVAAASVISSARDDRKDRKREEELEDLESDRLRRRDSDKKESKDDRRREKRSSPDRDSKKEKSRDKDKKKDDSDEKRREKKREKRRDETRDEKDERREKRREERRSERPDYEPRESARSEVSVSTAPIDPFMYQVRDDPFPTPTAKPSEGHHRAESVPSIVTVEREPDFTRKRSYSIKDQSSNYEPESRKSYFPPTEVDQAARDREERDRPLHKAEEIVEKTRHSTAPYDSLVMSAVITAEDERKSRSEQRRIERRDDYDDFSRTAREVEPEKKRDPIQEEADKAYREIVMARKIASEVIRQRTPSPNRSVVNKYEDLEDEEEEVIKIVTPPEMADQKKVGPYDAPNADFRPDYEFQSPTEVHTFVIPEISMTRSLPPGTLPKRDPDTPQPRPILNLVRPTPTPSPIPEKQIERSKPSRRRSKSGDREQPKRVSASEVGVSTEREPQPQYAASEVIIGPKGNVVMSPTASTVSKAVTWGENETKHYEVESPSDHREEFISNAEVRTREVPEEIKQGANSKTRGWGAIAGTIMGIGAVGAVAAASSDSSAKTQSKEEKTPASAYEYRGVIVEPDSPPRSRKSSPPRDQKQPTPPAPGPKPIISQTSHMPGSFDDDIEFTAAVAAGLKDTGFDPDIVINDPTFRRRDSPPGSNDGMYRSPFAETVSDLGTVRSEISGAQAFAIGDAASTTQDWRSVSPPREDETPTKLSKKEQKKRDKARRQSGDVTPLDETPVAREVAEEPESYFVEPKLSKKDQKKLDKSRRQSGDVTPLDDTPIAREVVAEPESYFVEPKLSKKEQKKRDKELQRQRTLDDDFALPVEPSISEQIVEEPESYFETPKKSKKSKNGSSSFDETPEESSRVSRSVSVPIDAYADLANGEDSWATETKKSKKSKRDSERFDSPARSVPSSEVGTEERSSSKKSKRDSDRYDSPARSVPSSEVGTEERSSSKKSKRDSSRYDSPTRSEVASEVGSSRKDKSKRRSESYDVDPTEVSLPPSTPSETSEFDDSRKSRKSSGRDSGIFSSADRGESRSVVSAGASRYDDEEPRKSKKKSRSGTKDDFDDTRSVASAPAGDDWEDSKKSKKKDKKDEKKDEKRSSGFFGFFGSKSESGAREESPKGSKDDTEDAKKKKKKRSSTTDSSSLYSGIGAASVGDLSRSMSVSNGKSNGNGSHHDYDQYEDGTRSDGEREKRKSRSRSESTSSKKDSFLGNTGTLGAGVGIAGAAVAIAAQQYRQSKAANTNDSERTEDFRSLSLERPSEREEALDPDIQHRAFRPSIDPQYGDLLPLPPSGPTSPNVEPIDELPGLPESRPGTPEADRIAKERAMSAINSFRKSQQETPTKSPSQSAVPVRFLLGNRSTPPSPIAVRSSPMQSPAAPNQEPLGFPKYKSRPTSWEGSKEFRPLYLVESHRRGSNAQLAEAEEAALPPSQNTSRSSSQHDFEGRGVDERMGDSADPLFIDTTLARSASPTELLGSQQSTPKAAFHDRDAEFGADPVETPRRPDSEYDLPSQPRDRSSSPTQSKKSGLSGNDIAAGIAVAGLAATAGHFLTSSMNEEDDKSDDPLLIERRPSPVDAVTKDRSSYLLKSSPIPSKFDDANVDSPIRQPIFSSSRDILHSIDEGENTTTAVSPEEVQRERERALESLSGTPTPQEEFTKELEPSGITEAEPSDEFAFTKSKKSKKDKRKSKGLSRSSTQDDISSFGEASVDTTPEEFATVEKDAIEETPVKSKSDKKKGKKKSKSFMAWDEPEETQQQPEELGSGPTESVPDPLPIPPSLFPDRTERAQETSTSYSDVKGKSIAESDPIQEPQTEEETDEFHDALDESLETPEIVATPPESPQVDEFFTPIKKKDKKKDKQKSKSISLESEDIAPQATPEAQTELHEDVFEDAQILVDEPAEEVTLSKSKKSKKDKRKSKSVESWDNDEPEVSQSTSDTAREIVDDVPVVSEPVIVDQPAEEEYSFSKSSKKDKKKRKSQVTFDPEVQTFDDGGVTSESSRAVVEDVPVIAEEPAEDLSFFKSSKKDKKKRKSQITFESEIPPIDNSVAPWQKEDEIPSEPVSLEVQHLEANETFPLVQSEDTVVPKDATIQESTTLPGLLESSTSHPIEDGTREVTPKIEQDPSQEIDATDEFAPFEGKKSKKKKRKSGLSWEADEDSPAAESSSKFPETNAQDEIVSGTATPDEFFVPETKKGKKNKGKSILADNFAEEPLTTPANQESEDIFDFAKPVSKKDKKKGKKSQSINFDDALLDQPAEEATVQGDTVALDESIVDDKPLDKDLDSFTPSDSKKSKKKSKKSQFTAFEPESPSGQETAFDIEKNAVAETIVDPEIPEEFTSSKKSKKKSKKSQRMDVGEEESPAMTANDDREVVESDNIVPAIETPTPKPTPIGGPGAWPITPATPRTGGEAEESSSKGYFATAAALIPAAAVGAALLMKNPFKKEAANAKESMPADTTDSKTLDTEEFAPPADNPESEDFTPDGLKAGYKDEQLSLARQLQEEFAGGNKKSKKEKKKRQSLPSTPDRLPSRSRAVDDLVEDHRRARSLSTDPSAERSSESPANTERANIYSEDQLELARQLKAEFENKKSKKEKKGRKGRSLTQDDDFVNQDIDEPEASGIDIQQTELPDSTPKGDGFAAGYQEDQLSLARQLQAEFGSGSTSKKSKKDKKRRSTSQTPLEQEPVDDYFGDQYRSAEPTQMDDPSNPLEPHKNQATPLRDGLAVGYNEDQLELARQMQEEFAAKKSKKDKKEKKRQSLLRGNTDDGFSSDAPQEFRDSDDLSKVETPPLEIVESSSNALPESEDDFAAFEKKSKKEKKAKKRGSLLRGTTNEDVGMQSTSREIDTPLTEDLSQTIAEEGSSEAAASQADADFISSKKSKKDRKGKKRESFMQHDVEDTPGPDFTSVSVDNLESVQPDIVEDTRGLTPTEIEDDFAPIKKSKKEKKSKNRDSLMQADAEEMPAPDLESAAVNQENNQSEIVEGAREPIVAEAEDEFAPTKKSKKEKKSKNRNSLIQADAAEMPTPDAESTLANQENNQSEIVEGAREPIVAEAEDEFAPTKKSKKEKKSKKRDSLMQAEFEEPLISSLLPTPADSEIAQPDLIDAPEAVVAEPEDDFAPVKKSKKEKKSKKRDSLMVDKNDEDTIKEQAIEETPISSSTFTQEPFPLTAEPQYDLSATHVEDAPADEANAEFFTSTKKSKKEKKAKKNEDIFPDSSLDVVKGETSRDLTKPAQLESESQVPVSTADDDFGFATSTKKSKKDKKKRQSITPQEEPSTQQDIEQTSQEIDLPSEIPIDHITASGSTTDAVDDTFDDFTSSKKTKKDKKKRQSLLRSSTFDETLDLEPATEESSIVPEARERDSVEPLASVVEKDDQDDNFEYSSKKSKKDKKNRKSLQQSVEVFDESSSKDLESSINPLVPEPAAEESMTGQPGSEEADNAEDMFGEYAFSKKSKKDKKKRKDSTKTDSAEASGYSTPLDPLSEAVEVATLPIESTADKSAVSESLETIPEKAIIPDDELPAPVEDEWGSMSRKNSKKNKSKGKKSSKFDFEESSGPSTPLESATEPIIPTFSTEPTFIEQSLQRGVESSLVPATQEQVDESVPDWEPTKKSKKDKKQKGSSKLDFEEPTSEPSEPIQVSNPAISFSAEPVIIDRALVGEPKSVVEVEPALQEPVDESFDAWTPKNSKKNKSRKDSSKTDFMEASSASLEPHADPVETNIPSLSTESTAFAQVQDVENNPADPVAEAIADETFEEWAPTKKSKKDKKKRKDSSKFDVDEPTSESIGTQVDDFTESNESKDTVEPALVVSEIQEEPQEEFSLSRKSSKKVKKNRKGSAKVDFDEPTEPPNQLESQPEPLQEAFHDPLPIEEPTEDKVIEDLPQQDPDIVKETPTGATADQPFEEWAPTKKSKKDKKKGKSFSTFDFEESPAPSAPLETVSETLAATPLTSLPVEEPSEKDTSEKEILGPMPETDLSPGTGLSMTPAEESTIEPFEEWAPTKKSKKDKKKGKSLATLESEELPVQPASSEPVAESLEKAIPTSLLAEEPVEKDNLDHAPDPTIPIIPTEESNVETFEEWAPTKKSKKDKKKRKDSVKWDETEPPEASTTQPFEEVVEGLAPSSAPAEKAILQEVPKDFTAQEIIADEPITESFEEWAPTKKSKKDKKKRKESMAADSEEQPGSSAPLEAPSDNKDIVISSDTPEEQVANTVLAGQDELSRDIIQDYSQEPEEEWEGTSAKKSKKDKKKRKSGLSTPLEGVIGASALAGALAFAATQATDESSSKDPTPEIGNDKATIAEPEDEWGSALTKKSKKDKKKRKSGLSTPFEEPVEPFQSPLDESEQPIEKEPHAATEPQDASSHESKDVIPVEDKPIELADDWDPVPAKKSKKDKKRKSGLSTPIDDPIPELERSILQDDTQPLASKGLPSEQPTSSAEPFHTEHAVETSAREFVDQPEDEWGAASTKKSKKDKNKQKSGVPTPVEPAQEPNKSSFEEKEASAIVEPPVQSTEEFLDQDPTAPSVTQEISSEPNDEWSGPFEPKKSKKDKKKRKSGLSTPIEESLPTERDAFVQDSSSKAIQHSEPIDLFHAATPSFTAFGNEPQARDQRDVETNVPEEKSLDSTVQGTQFLESPVEEAKDEDATEDPFAFVTKRSKKEKKGKRASKFDSESEPIISAPANAPLQTEKAEASIAESEYPATIPFVGEPRALELETSTTTDKTPIVEEQIEPFTLSRKGSKKDKRKRQPTIDASTNESGSSVPPLTSWADDVEEAQVERDLPVIEEIAKDESLSHIPIMSPSTDDFVRPSKKGKKTSRRKESLTESPITESYPVGTDASNKDSEDKKSKVPIIAAAGAAAVAAAALLSKAENSNPSDSVTPARKLSKKEKRKMSIDKRAPKEDMFDDPALWEGADPMVYEETRGGEDDAGSDGFWSPPQEETVEPAPQEELPTVVHSRDASSFIDARDETARALSPPATPEPDVPATSSQPFARQSEVVVEAESKPFEPTSQDSGGLEATEGAPSDFFIASSKKDKKKRDVKTASPRVSETTIEDSQALPPTTPRALVESPITIVERLPSNKGISFDEQSPMNPEHIASPPKDRDQQEYFQRRAFSPEFERNSPTTSRAQTPRSSRPRLSDLPVVHEENLAQIETARPSQHQRHLAEEPNRDSGFSGDSPVVHGKGFADHHDNVRDSGVHLREDSPAGRSRGPVTSTDDALARLSWPSVDEDTETVDLHRSQRPKATPSKKHGHEVEKTPEAHDSKRSKNVKVTDLYRSQRTNEESPISVHQEKSLSNRDLLPSQMKDEPHSDIHRTPTIHGRKLGENSLVKQRMQRFESPDLPKPSSSKIEAKGPEIRKLDLGRDDLQRSQSPKLDHSQTPKLDRYAELNASPRPRAEKPQGISEIQTAGVVAGVAIAGASLGFAAARKISQEKRPDSAQGLKSSPNINRLRTPDIKRPDSVGSNRSATPPLRRTDRQTSGDLRSLSQRSKPDLAKEAELAAITASAVNTANPTANEGRARAKDMADVYDGFGEGRMGSPRSPTRPHSMRRRQSMQVLDLESKVEQLAAENRMLADAKAQAERTLMSSQHASSSLVEKDSEIDSLKRTLDWLQNEVQRLTEVNEGLTSANVVIARQHSDRYGMLESQHAEISRELQETRDAHNNLSAGMDGIVQNEVQTAVLEKDRVIAQLRAELDTAKERIREMQRQILASKASDVDFLTIRDEDYFDNACQQLCQHVQQWVLRFSKFSDMRACRLTSEINNDKTIDRLDNAILDGSDVDSYLADRVKRRDVFMSMTMTMVWEFVFTRYLFGMDREQRQKLKSLEKTLSEVGPQAAVHQWRATTLTLLAKREAFAQQREQDTQAVVHAILETLSEILPPPSHLETQIEDQLTRVMKAAVDLSIEMRTQRAEYMMLPPLQPEYDANGDLASKVSFNSALMNERSGDTVSNEDLETQKAVVRIVLFPLVVKKGDDRGEGDEEIVVCPAQVLCNPGADGRKKARFMDGTNHSRVSMQSTMPAGDDSVI